VTLLFLTSFFSSSPSGGNSFLHFPLQGVILFFFLPFRGQGFFLFFSSSPSGVGGSFFSSLPPLQGSGVLSLPPLQGSGVLSFLLFLPFRGRGFFLFFSHLLTTCRKKILFLHFIKSEHERESI